MKPISPHVIWALVMAAKHFRYLQRLPGGGRMTLDEAMADPDLAWLRDALAHVPVPTAVKS